MDNSSIDASPERSFTVKSLLFGLVGACTIVAGAAISPQLDPNATPLIGNFLPPAPILFILLLALVWNPLVGRIRGMLFSPRELAVALGLILICSWVPYSSLYRGFQRSIVMPPLQADTRPEWRKQNTLGHLPTSLFPLGGSAETASLLGAIAAERQDLADGRLDAVLGTAACDRPGYAAALDLAELVPPRLWLDADGLSLARDSAERAWQRYQAGDPKRWAAAGTLLGQLPNTLAPGAGTPPAWVLARTRLSAGMGERLPAARHDFEQVYTGMLQGLPSGDQILSPKDIPVRPWLPTLAYWTPLVICFGLAILMLALVVHRQWSRHEQLTYPIASVATAMVQRSPGRRVSDVLASRLFWWGAVPVIAVHTLNYIALWFPGWVPSIPLRWSNLGAALTVFPSLIQTAGVDNIYSGSLYFSIIGLAYFIASEVSLSLGVCGLAAVLLTVQWYALTGGSIDLPATRSGAYVGYAAILLFTGRHYYWAVLLRAFGLRGGATADHAEPVWAARLFLLSFVGLIWVLTGAFALDWLIATTYALTMLILFLVISRIVCETGMPFIQAGWQPAQLLANTLGISAIGPGPLVLICYLGSILTQDPRESLMPFAATAFKITENTGVPRLRFAIFGSAAMLIAMVVGLIAVSWGLYNFGSSRDGYAQNTGGWALDTATRGLSDLVATGQYQASAAASGLEKIPLISEGIDRVRGLSWTVFGVVAVIAFSLLRFRFTGFILHPVLFLVWGTYPAICVWSSFLLGWGIKSLVVRFGGGRVYQDLKPLFIGLIAGELSMAGLTICTGWIYFLVTGLTPRSLNIFPG